MIFTSVVRSRGTRSCSANQAPSSSGHPDHGHQLERTQELLGRPGPVLLGRRTSYLLASVSVRMARREAESWPPRPPGQGQDWAPGARQATEEREPEERREKPSTLLGVKVLRSPVNQGQSRVLVTTTLSVVGKPNPV